MSSPGQIISVFQRSKI